MENGGEIPQSIYKLKDTSRKGEKMKRKIFLDLSSLKATPEEYIKAINYAINNLPKMSMETGSKLDELKDIFECSTEDKKEIEYMAL